MRRVFVFVQLRNRTPYVNKSGGADIRFSNNKRIPIYLHGELEMRSIFGFNTMIMFSTPNVSNK